MKSFKFSFTASSLLKIIIPIFFLSIFLQGLIFPKTCTGSTRHKDKKTALEVPKNPLNKKALNNLIKTPASQLLEALQSTYAPSFFTENINTIVFELVNSKESEKIEVIVKHAHNIGETSLLKKALNECYSTQGKKTLLGIAIKKNNQKMVELLIQQVVDFNKKHEESTPLLLAMRNDNKKITSTLLRQQGIDITGQSPNSRNTTLHRAIKNNWEDIANDLIERLKQTEKGSKLLYAQNKEGDTPLHFAAKYRLKSVQAELIKNLSVDQIYIENNQGQDAVRIGSENNQTHLVEHIMRAPLERLTRKNKEGETSFHTFARLHLPNAFNKIFKRVQELNEEEAVKQLFEKTKDGKSVWVYMILDMINIPHIKKIETGPFIVHRTNATMFKDTILSVKHNLTKPHWDAIKNDIARLEKGIYPFGITQSYAREL